MCHEAAETIDIQCGREYAFGKFLHEKPRATQVLFLQKKGSTVITKALQTPHQDGEDAGGGMGGAEVFESHYHGVSIPSYPWNLG